MLSIPETYALFRTDTLNLSLRVEASTAGRVRHLGFEDVNSPGFTLLQDPDGISIEQFSLQAQLDEIDAAWPGQGKVASSESKGMGNLKKVMIQLPTLETERLVLRPLMMSDVEHIYHQWAKDPDVSSKTSWLAHQSLEETHLFVQTVVNHYQQGVIDTWGIVLKETNTLIGTGGFTAKAASPHLYEFGYVLAKPYWNQGLMTEAGSTMISWATDTLSPLRIQSLVAVGNEASVRVLEKIGFLREGVLARYVVSKQKVFDVYMFALIPADAAS